jgi:phytol kinase
MLPFILSLIVAGIVVGGGELLRRKLDYGNEVSRKLVHMTHGALVAYWPFIIGYELVIVLEVLFIFAVFAVHELHWFPWLWRVGRRSWGQYLFPVGVIIAALLADSPWIFLAAVLELGLADAAAALVGKRYGRGHFYKILGQKKSIIGSLAFFVVSLIVLGAVLLLSPLAPIQSVFATIILLSAILMTVENLGVYGSDNLLLPVATVLLLNAIS